MESAAADRAEAKAEAKVKLEERFDYGALKYITDNFESYAPTFRPDTDKQETLAMIKRYLAKAKAGGTMEVTYRRSQPGHGRLFAERGMSLQCMVREIRNAIAFPFYEDLDFENCHPVLLVQMCEKSKVPIQCPLLHEYCAKRLDVLVMLSRELRQPQTSAKAAVLAIINGGAPAKGEGGKEVRWLTAFASEMRAVREELVGKCDSPYLIMARKKQQTLKKSLLGKGGSFDQSLNLMGSATNLLLCDSENEHLMVLKEFSELILSRRVGVLVFDGCMIEQKDGEPITADMLKAASEYIHARTGYWLNVVVKDMTKDRLQVPSTVYAQPFGKSLIKSVRYAVDDVTAGLMFLQDIAGIVLKGSRGLYVRDVNDVVWTSNKTTVEEVLLKRCLSANILHVTERGGTSAMSGNVPSAKRIVTAATAQMPKDMELESKMWESVIGCLCYKNGLYDFRQGRFFTYAERPDVMPTIVIPRDFPTQRPSGEVATELMERVFLSTLGSVEVANTYLQLIGRAMAGEYTDKQWGSMLGERNSGKGVLQELNQLAYGPYVNTVNANAFLLQQHAPTDAAKSLSWALDCEFTRLTYTNEVKCDATSKTIKLDGNMLKSFQSGGDIMSARKNYTNEVSFRVASKLIMNLNDMPEIAPRDAVATLVLIKFPFKFMSCEEMAAFEAASDSLLPFFKLRDDTLKTEFLKRSEVIDAFTWMVIDAYAATHGPVVPCKSVTTDMMEFREDVGDDLVVMAKRFKVTGDRTDFVTVKDIKLLLADLKVSSTIAHSRLKKMGAWKDDNCCVNGKRHGRGFLGVKLVSSEDDATFHVQA